MHALTQYVRRVCIEIAVLWICVVGLCISGYSYARLLCTTKKTRARAQRTPFHCHGKVSVIIPLYNEASIIARTLQALDQNVVDKRRVEIILVDAGCKDNTMEVVKSCNCELQITFTKSSGGRGPALNQGARIADGDLFLFLHADTIVPPRWDDILRSELVDPVNLCVGFKFGVDRSTIRGSVPAGLWIMERAANFRAFNFQLPYGDQGLAITAHKFRQCGGFPDIVIMEDFEFIWKLRREAVAGAGKIKVLSYAQTLCSSRRWERNGVFKNTLLNQLYVIMYVYFQATPQQIYRWYYVDGPHFLPWLTF